MSFLSGLADIGLDVVSSVPGVSSIPLVGGLLSGAKGAVAKYEAREAEDRSYNRQLAMMKMQNDYNTDMWNKTNEYNSPANQVKLLEQAGLNPNLVNGAGNPTASMASGASGSAPYDSQAGERVRIGRESVLSSLQTDAQIAKLRNEIKYQEMVNDDYRLLLDSHKDEYSYPDIEDDLYDYGSDGAHGLDNFVTVHPDKKYNYYQEQRIKARDEARALALANARNAGELSNFLYAQNWLREMPKRQLESLIEDIRSKSLSNELLGNDVEMLKKYGISSRDSNAFTALMRAAVRDPDNVSRILRNILKGAFSGASGVIDEGFGQVRSWLRHVKGSRRVSPSHRNPVRGSW